MRLSVFFARLGYLLADDNAEYDVERQINSCQAVLEQQNFLLDHYSRTLLEQAQQVRQCRRPAEDWVVDKNGHCIKVFLVITLIALTNHNLKKRRTNHGTMLLSVVRKKEGS